MKMILLSHYQAEKLLQARKMREARMTISLDLGLTSADVRIEQKKVCFPDEQELSWEQVESIQSAENSCFVVEQDSLSKVQFFSETERFDRIIHDPPAFSLAGDLYSGVFYQQLYRVLRTGGRMFHYIGDPMSKSGRNITAGVVARMKTAGFRTVKKAPRAFGVVGYK